MLKPLFDVVGMVGEGCNDIWILNSDVCQQRIMREAVDPQTFKDRAQLLICQSQAMVRSATHLFDLLNFTKTVTFDPIEISLRPSFSESPETKLGNNLILTPSAKTDNIGCYFGVVDSAKNVVESMVGEGQQKNLANIILEEYA
jgi:hypothetical protein